MPAIVKDTAGEDVEVVTSKDVRERDRFVIGICSGMMLAMVTAIITLTSRSTNTRRDILADSIAIANQDREIGGHSEMKFRMETVEKGFLRLESKADSVNATTNAIARAVHARVP